MVPQTGETVAGVELAKVNAAQQGTGADSLQKLEAKLEQALGLPSDALTLSLDGKAVKVDYDTANDKFTPLGTGSNCGYACHTIVKAKDYVFTEYGKR